MEGYNILILCFTILFVKTLSVSALSKHQNGVSRMQIDVQKSPYTEKLTLKTPVKKVHIISMNHLDVGYYDGRDSDTGLAVEVLNRYMTEYFTQAINISRSLEIKGYTERFIYTTQPWLVSLYTDCPNISLMGTPLKCPSAKEVADFNQAVKEGRIVWHAGPMNMQTDNMASPLFNAGLDLSKDLDKKFGINRTHAVYSQRDVPGLTKGVINNLRFRGVKAISVGVNPGTAPPALPSPCLWKADMRDDDGIIFFQVKGGYPLNPGPDPAHPGGLSPNRCHTVPGLDEVLCFAFRTDNTGPPTEIQEVLSYYEILRAEFPGAALVASTLDAFVAKVEPLKHTLPVSDLEMGDTWIQGITSDPKKTAKYRSVARTWMSCVQQGQCDNSDSRIKEFLRFLIKQPEHTWGAHQYLDVTNWTNPELAYARRCSPDFQATEISWLEQRQFLDFALNSLKDHPLRAAAYKDLETLEPVIPDLSDYEQISLDQEFKCSDGLVFRVEKDGSLSRLYDPYSKTEWASDSQRLAQLSYDTYTEQDFVQMGKLYNYLAGVGYDKPNVTQYAHPEHKRWPIEVTAAYRKKSDPGCEVLVKLQTSDPQTRSKYGAPQAFYLTYSKNIDNPGLDVTLLLEDKVTTRLPESISLNFYPDHQHQQDSQGQIYRWFMDKMNTPVDPCHVVLNGSQYVHAVNNGVSLTNRSAGGLYLATRDTPLVLISTADRPTSPFPVPLQPISCKDITGMGFNIFNNIWNTNYIYYYPYREADRHFKSRFSIFFT